MSDIPGNSGPKPKLSRRKFLVGSSVTVAGAAVATSGISLLSERAEAFFNMGAFWKKPVGNGQTSNGYTIGQSLRFDRTRGCSLTRTGGTPTAQGRWTYSLWIKHTSPNTTQPIYLFLGAGNDGGGNNDFLGLRYNSGTQGSLYLTKGTYEVLQTSVAFRDPSAWYHLVLAADTSAATATTKLRLFVNGTEITSYSIDARASYAGSNWNINGSGIRHSLGAQPMLETSNPFDGYIAEVSFIDGQALDPSFFGQTDSSSGQWIPKQAAISDYGKNGCYLNFSNGGSLGTDSAPISGNHTAANNWTPNNFNTYDQVLDSPTNNFSILNPIGVWGNVATNGFSNGSLTVQCDTTGYSCWPLSTMFVGAGKWYWEVHIDTSSNDGYTGWSGGIADIASPAGTGVSNACAIGKDALSWFFGGSTSNGDHYIYHSNATSTYGSTVQVSDTVQFALDLDNGSWFVGRNGSWFNSSNPATNSLPAVSGLAGKTMTAGISAYYGSKTSINFGQGGQTGLTYDAASGGRFKYTPPTGFKALCTANLSVPTIKKPTQYFNSCLFTGNGGTLSITGAGHQPDMVWVKSRSAGNQHGLWDSVRGAPKYLVPNLTDTEVNIAGIGISSFDSNGFSVGSNATYNGSATTFVAWSWKAGTSAQSGNESLNTTSGFSIVKYTKTTNGAENISHSLGVIPNLIVVKSRTTASHWRVYHSSMNATPQNGYLTLSALDAYTVGSSPWNNTAPTSTQFTVGGSWATGEQLIAYLWAEVAGFSKFGSYTGNGSADGPFVYCGFKPRFILIKNTATTDNWMLHDTARSTSNPSVEYLIPNQSIAENTNDVLDVLSNGFKIRVTYTPENGSGNTLIFAAFAEAPFKYANAR
jgi:hypothetical protein